MNYWRCECGEAEYFESGMPPRSCQGCEKCGTRFGFPAIGYKKLEPHDWEERIEGPVKNPRTYKQCKRCYAREKIGK